jgi:hypothetical protein
VDNVREAQIEALDLLERAAIAMRRAQPNDEGAGQGDVGSASILNCPGA